MRVDVSGRPAKRSGLGRQVCRDQAGTTGIAVARTWPASTCVALGAVVRERGEPHSRNTRQKKDPPRWRVQRGRVSYLTASTVRSVCDRGHIACETGLPDSGRNCRQEGACRTSSGSGPGSCGSILEATHGGTQPIILASGEDGAFSKRATRSSWRSSWRSS